MTGMTFDKGQIERLLAELGQELDNDGVRAEMFIVGGYFDQRRVAEVFAGLEGCCCAG